MRDARLGCRHSALSEDVPPPLAGRPFTQVVANAVSPIDLEMLTAGRVYVLVGTDWDGCSVAREHLAEVGYREPLPPLFTEAGARFEVRSILGETGDTLTLPT